MSSDPRGKRSSVEELAREAAEWASGARTPRGAVDAPEAVPNAGRAKAISLRVPTELLAILRGFAKREGIGYQVLIKRWLDDRVRAERERLRSRAPGRFAQDATGLHAPGFPLSDSPDPTGSHYVQ